MEGLVFVGKPSRMYFRAVIILMIFSLSSSSSIWYRSKESKTDEWIKGQMYGWMYGWPVVFVPRDGVDVPNCSVSFHVMCERWQFWIRWWQGHTQYRRKFTVMRPSVPQLTSGRRAVVWRHIDDIGSDSILRQSNGTFWVRGTGALFCRRVSPTKVSDPPKSRALDSRRARL